nr:lysozyme inhibitor LprI family protein [Sphingomicrobium lutaoense]
MPLLLLLAQSGDEPDCSDTGAFSQAELNWCAWHDYQAADAELNRLWSALGDDWRDRMRPAQRAWLAYRDAQCGLEASIWEGGSAESMVTGMCLERLTRLRIEEIRHAHPEGLPMPEDSQAR